MDFAEYQRPVPRQTIQLVLFPILLRTPISPPPRTPTILSGRSRIRYEKSPEPRCPQVLVQQRDSRMRPPTSFTILRCSMTTLYDNSADHTFDPPSRNEPGGARAPGGVASLLVLRKTLKFIPNAGYGNGREHIAPSSCDSWWRRASRWRRNHGTSDEVCAGGA